LIDADAQRAYLKWCAQFLQSRRELAETALWEGPALALTAQAFLLTICLAADTPAFGRIIASLLASCTSAAAIYLILRKRRQGRIADSELHSIIFKLYKYHPYDLDEKLPRRLKMKSHTAWLIALIVFAMADILIFILAARDWSTLSSS
jgi:hypothetical protein